jgi:hypothetical protein
MKSSFTKPLLARKTQSWLCGMHCNLGPPMIQAEIGGHPPILLAQNRCFHLGSCFLDFWVPNFQGCFEALNDVFWAYHSYNVDLSHSVTTKMCIPRINLSNELSYTQNGERMKNLCPWEVDISTTSIGARKPFGVSSSRVRVLYFLYVKKASRASL